MAASIRRPLATLLAVALVAALVAAIASPAAAADEPPAVLYGSTSGGDLFTIDLETGAGTLVGTLPDTGTEIECDPDAPIATAECWQQAPRRALEAQRFDLSNAAPIGSPVPNVGVFNGLEYAGGTLYGTYVTLVFGSPTTLAVLDPGTGMSTDIGETGVGPISGLAWDGETMFGVSAGGAPATLHTIDLTTGVATAVGPPTGVVLGSLEFGPDGKLYAGGARADSGNLYEIDPATGAATLVGLTGFSDPITGLTLPNVPPVVASPLPTVNVPENSAPVVLEVDDLFTEPNAGQTMTFGAISSDPDLVTASVGSPLTLTFATNRSGTATVTVTATDSVGASSEADISVTVGPLDHDVGLHDPATGQWHLRKSGTGTVTSFFFGNPGDLGFMGDWNCDGIDTPGLYRQSDGFVYLRDANSTGIADIEFFFGDPGDVPVAGDFNGDGCDTVSIYRPSEQRFYIVNALGEDMGGLGPADFSFVFGNPGDSPTWGDWDGDGTTEVGLYRESAGFFYSRDTLSTGNADDSLFFGDPDDLFVGGDWGVVDGKDSPAVFRGSVGKFFFKHELVAGVADSEFFFGADGFRPVSGQFGL